MKCLTCKKPLDSNTGYWRLQPSDRPMYIPFCCLEHIEDWLKHLPYGDARDKDRTDMNGVVDEDDIVYFED